MQDVGLRDHLAVKTPLLTARHRRQRLGFAREYIHTLNCGNLVVRSLDRRFTIVHSDGPIVVHRRRVEKGFVVQIGKFGDGT